MRAHIVKEGLVVDTIEVDSLDFMPGLIDGTIGGEGWVVVGDTLQPPVPTLPSADESNAAIMAQLEAIDAKSIRAIREGDQARIANWNAQADMLRSKLIK